MDQQSEIAMIGLVGALIGSIVGGLISKNNRGQTTLS